VVDGRAAVAVTAVPTSSAFISPYSPFVPLHVKQALFMAAPKPSGFANTKAGKTAILERTKKLLETTELIITIPIDGVTKEQVDILRKELPKTTKASIVKNKLFGLAIKDTKFEAASENLKGENMYLFIQEGEGRPTYDGLKKWQKEVKRTEPQFAPKFAVMEGQLYPSKSVEAVANLPTKKELITKIALGIKSVPTKVAKGVKAVPNKLGRAIGALKNKLEEEAK
jgi:large subunit ribosomal protein L10